MASARHRLRDGDALCLVAMGIALLAFGQLMTLAEPSEAEGVPPPSGGCDPAQAVTRGPAPAQRP